MILMVLAFLLVFGLGCAAILVMPGFVARWRALGNVNPPEPAPAPIQPVDDPDSFDPRLTRKRPGERSDEPVARQASTHRR